MSSARVIRGGSLHSSMAPARAIPLLRICRTPDCERVVAAWMLYEDVNELYSCDYGWADPETPLPRPYEIREVEEKGHGMFTTRKIERGELIVRERPILMQPNGLRSSMRDPWSEMDKRILQLLLFLEDEDRLKVLRLHNCKRADECGPFAGIARTNAVGAEWPQSDVCKEYGAICLDISRVNHSCAPNASYSWNGENITFELRAKRDIEAGEEVEISYINPDLPYADRQAELELKYKFTCACPKCSAYASSPLSQTPRAKRERFIASIVAPLKSRMMWLDWLRFVVSSVSDVPPSEINMRAKKELESIEALLREMDKEGMRGTVDHQRIRVEACEYCACISSHLAEEDNFKKWAKKCAKEADELGKGKRKGKRKGKGKLVEFSEIAQEWRRWAEEPKSHPMWNFANDEDALRSAMESSDSESDANSDEFQEL